MTRAISHFGGISFLKSLQDYSLSLQLTSKEALSELFSNTTWSSQKPTAATMEVLSHWQTSYSNIYVTLTVFVLLKVNYTFFARIPLDSTRQNLTAAAYCKPLKQLGHVSDP